MTKGCSWGDFAQHNDTQKIFSGQAGNVIKLREHYAHTGVGFPQINADQGAQIRRLVPDIGE